MRSWPVRAAEGMFTFFLTGTDEHGQKVERTARNTASRRRNRPTPPSCASRKRGSDCASGTTTSSARRRPVTSASSGGQRFQALWDKGEIYAGSYEGLVLRA